LKFPEAATATDFAPGFVNGGYILAIGLENGKILIFQSEANNIEKLGFDAGF